MLHFMAPLIGFGLFLFVAIIILYYSPWAKQKRMCKEESILTDWMRARMQNEKILTYFFVISS